MHYVPSMPTISIDISLQLSMVPTKWLVNQYVAYGANKTSLEIDISVSLQSEH